MSKKRSEALFEEASRYFPGGVDSPVRAFSAVGGSPLFISKGRGSRMWDEDGNEYIDYVCSWGPLILGHAHPQVVEAVKAAADRGTSYGAPTELETRLGKLICDALPSVEMVRFVSSGTEATMSALRLARAFTGRDKIIKFAGCYHGHSDGLLAKAGSGATTLGVPDSPGVPQGYACNTLIARYNDLDSVRTLLQEHHDVAAIVVEPVAANMGVVLPAPDFLSGLRALSRETGALLVFDEVITGFRVAFGGAQELYGVMPDLTCLGKTIGGGLPVGAYGGRGDIMQMVAPSGPVYQAGTLSGNPLAMTAGIETLNILKAGQAYEQLEQKGFMLEDGIKALISPMDLDVSTQRIGSLLTLFFISPAPSDYDSARQSDTPRFAAFFHRLLQRGIYWPPSQFESAFISIAHTDADIERTITAIGEALSPQIRQQ